MPGGDGTGPTGMGPMTGRAAGFCAGFAASGYPNGFGGRGGGFGRRNRYFATSMPGWQRAALGPLAPGLAPSGVAAAPSREQQLAVLKGQAEQVESTLSALRRRIGDLETDDQ